MRSDVAVRTHLRPLELFFAQDDVTEISINRPQEVWIARQGHAYMERHSVAELDLNRLETLAQLIAQYTDTEVSAEREVKLKQPNALHLLASRGAQGQAKVTPQDLLESCLRLRPNRIIMGELRGVEAFTYLEAINSGHPGSLTTIHADSPEFALERLALMIMRAGTPMTKAEIAAYLKLTVPIIVQFTRDAVGNRFISQIRHDRVLEPTPSHLSTPPRSNLVRAANG